VLALIITDQDPDIQSPTRFDVADDGRTFFDVADDGRTWFDVQ
jgi:hypothetical protein